MQVVNLAHQQLELKPLKTGNEYLVAKRSVKVRDCDIEAVKIELRRSMLMAGLRSSNFPGDEEKIILIEFIRRNYGFLSVNEISFAFNCALVGKLDLGTDGANCYENFSCQYVAKILTAYMSYAAKLLKESENITEPEPVALLQSPETDWSDTYERLLQSARDGNLYRELIPEPLYGWVCKHKGLELTKEEKLELKERAIHSLRAIATEREEKGIADKEDKLLRREILTESEKYREKIKIRARQLAVLQFIQSESL